MLAERVPQFCQERVCLVRMAVFPNLMLEPDDRGEYLDANFDSHHLRSCDWSYDCSHGMRSQAGREQNGESTVAVYPDENTFTKLTDLKNREAWSAE